jgi:hypothetical protein
MAFREDGFATAAGATICRAGEKSPRQQSKTLNAVEIEEAISALAEQPFDTRAASPISSTLDSAAKADGIAA